MTKKQRPTSAPQSFLAGPRRQEIDELLSKAGQIGLSCGARNRLHWFAYAIDHDGNISLTCRHFGIACSTFVRWAKRFDPDDPTTLENRSKRPKRMRKSDVPPEVVEYIRQERLADPRISRERIRQKLAEEHSITLSAYSIGHVIRRHGFFFADTPSHWIKRERNSLHMAHDQHEQEIADQIVSSHVRAIQGAITLWAATVDEWTEQQEQSVQRQSSPPPFIP